MPKNVLFENGIFITKMKMKVNKNWNKDKHGHLIQNI